MEQRSDRSRQRQLIVLGVLLVVFFAVVAPPIRTAVWRSVYPYLPRQLQALPYRLAARLSAGPRTIEGLPTPANLPGAIETAGLLPNATPIPAGTLSITAQAALPSPPDPELEMALPARTLPPAALLDAPRHEYQTWNNCGPATLSMALGVLGANVNQRILAQHLKPDPDDKNVSPEELAAEASRQGYRAMVRVAGTVDALRALVAAGFPVVVESWFIPEPGDEMGHYLLVIGYDDAARHLIAYDSYHGPNQTLDYDAFDRLWRYFNRLYIVFYRQSQADEVSALLGPMASDQKMWRRAQRVAQTELASQVDAVSAYNLGSSDLALGDVPAATAAFDQARKFGLPWRFLWYQFGAFEAYAAAGRWSDVEALVAANLRNAPDLEESHYWHGRALEAAGRRAEAAAAFQRALDLNPNFAAAASAIAAGP